MSRQPAKPLWVGVDFGTKKKAPSTFLKTGLRGPGWRTPAREIDQGVKAARVFMAS